MAFISLNSGAVGVHLEYVTKERCNCKGDIFKYYFQRLTLILLGLIPFLLLSSSSNIFTIDPLAPGVLRSTQVTQLQFLLNSDDGCLDGTTFLKCSALATS